MNELRSEHEDELQHKPYAKMNLAYISLEHEFIPWNFIPQHKHEYESNLNSYPKPNINLP